MMRKAGLTTRLLALLLCLVMVFTTVPTAAFAGEITDDVPVAQPVEADEAAVDTETPQQKPQEQEDAPVEIYEVVEEAPAPALAAGGTIRQLTVHLTDADGNYTHYDTAKQDGNAYWAYQVPGDTCLDTIPEAEVTESSTDGCQDHTYTWEDGSYIRLTLDADATVSGMAWEGNVLGFQVGDESYTLTVKDRNVGTLSALREKFVTGVTASMTDTREQVMARANAVEMPEGIEKKVNYINAFHTTAVAGTPENPQGTDGQIQLQVQLKIVDEVDESTTIIYNEKKMAVQVIDLVETALPYDESARIAVTAEAYGPGTVEAAFDSLVACQNSEGYFVWASKYALTATPGEKSLFFQWDYEGDAPYKVTSDNSYVYNHLGQKKIYVTVMQEQTFTAYFAENAAPTVSSSAPTSATAEVRTYCELNFLGGIEDLQTLSVNGKTYRKEDSMDAVATLDGEALGTADFDVWYFKKAFNEAGEHTLVVTATDSVGQSASVTVPITITPSATVTEHKFQFTASYQGEDISWGEDGLNAAVTYKAGPNGQFPLDNLDNEYFDTKNKYWIQIDNWSALRDSKNFYSLTIADVEVMAADVPTSWKYWRINNRFNGFGISYYAGKDQLQMWFNVQRNLNNLTEDVNLHFNFDIPATYTPTVTVSEAGGGTIDSLKLYKNLEEGSSWKLTTTPNLSWLLDYIQIGDDEATRVTSEDGKTITWTVTAENQAYTAYFRQIPKAELTENWKLGQNGDYARRSTSFGRTGNFVFTPYADYTTSVDYPQETETNTLLYTEQVNLVTEVNFKAEYPAGSVFKGVLYNGEGTEGAVLDSRESTLSKDLVPGNYGVDFIFNLPENAGKVTMALTLGAGTEQEFVLTQTFDLTESGITFRAPVESDYAKVVVQVGEAIGPTMVKDFKFYGGMKFLLGAYEDVLRKEADKGYKSIVIDSVNGYMNTIVLSYDEPTIAGSVYGEKNFGNGTWGWVTYLVNSWFVDLGIGSWGFYGNEIMQWSGLYSTAYGAPHTAAITRGDTWGVAVLRQYYSDDELIEAGVGSKLLTAQQLAKAYPDHADEILNRQIVPNEIKPTFDDIVEKINAIGEVTRDSGEAITAARAAYAAIPKTYFGSAGYFPALFGMCEPYKTALATLTAAEKAFQELKDPDELVELQIDTLGDITLESGNAILAARKAYDALDESWQAKVDNYATLQQAEATYTQLQSQQRNQLETAQNIYTTTGTLLAGQAPFSFGSSKGEWAVLGLARSGKTVDDTYYENIKAHVAQYIDENERLDANKVTDNARLILALTAIGKDVTNVAGHNLLKGMDDLDYVKEQGLNGPIWALIAINSHSYEIPGGRVTAQKLISHILRQQLADGGWALVGEVSDPDITGMALQALAPYYDEMEEVTAAVDKALAALSDMQNADGSYSLSGNEKPEATAESTAQIITALTALGIDPTKDSRFIKYGNSTVDALRKFYITGGGFAHTLAGAQDQLATEQGYYALASYYRLAEKKTSLYDMSDVEIVIPVQRLSGDNRWVTARKIADQLKETLNVEKFQTIIVASGNDFADALAGSYLSTAKNAPILLSWGNGGRYDYLDSDNIDYIRQNLAEGGMVYILGGEKAVPELYETGLEGLNFQRLNGANRFETNLKILNEAGVASGSEILVCSSTSYADSLSASATGKPVLLVWNERGVLTDSQKTFLEGLTDCTFTVIGGERAVCAELEEALGAYGEVRRLSGDHRFATSALVAETYFQNPEALVLTYGYNYPDGLCGGLLAHAMNAPMLLCVEGWEQAAADYAAANGITSGFVLGGESLLSAGSVNTVFPNN